MSKQSQRKYYAVRSGRQGPQIYSSWEEVHNMMAISQVSRYPGATHKSFKSLSQAQEWLNSAPNIDCDTARDVPPDATSEASHDEAADALKNMTLAPNIDLSPEQQAVLDMVKDGRNVFFTGSAGMCALMVSSGGRLAPSHHRYWKICPSPRDHSTLWWPRRGYVGNHSRNRHCLSEHWGVYPPLLGRSRNREGDQGTTSGQARRI
ncbi:hypothetical protein FOMPIDRAFT_44005 [Fomitopsis schrenkii]|uniref:Ribonuclease H1 N-terminal domain-containing protein n=1 Tax=Fomitopsis schrenkii TaxID=2126942 RepID=S8FT67_FOMSC|nr:hypothetical protein FOMPIDRAFT_44005 [Fomitopsis schrenkii]